MDGREKSLTDDKENIYFKFMYVLSYVVVSENTKRGKEVV